MNNDLADWASTCTIVDDHKSVLSLQKQIKTTSYSLYNSREGRSTLEEVVWFGGEGIPGFQLMV